MYDEQLRLRKAQDPTSAWSLVDYELWLIYMNNITSSPGTGNQMVSSDMKNGALKCYNFNLTIKGLNAGLISIFASSADLPQLYIISKILSREE
jgi:hypothetical protein